MTNVAHIINLDSIVLFWRLYFKESKHNCLYVGGANQLRTVGN